MHEIVNYSVEGASTKGPMEDIHFENATRRDIEDFFEMAADRLHDEIKNGYFDDEH
jgi:hypothetical protein